MSTYDEEHDLNTDRELQSETQTNVQGTRQRRHQTLQQTLDNFLSSTSNSRSHSGTIAGIPLAQNEEMNPRMIAMIESMIASSNNLGVFGDETTSKGVDNTFLDTLERVSVKTLTDDDSCPICTNEYKSDSHPLVVELPCNSKHRFDLECIGPWLKSNRTCPLCRVDVTEKKEKEILVDSEEEEEDWEMYG